MQLFTSPRLGLGTLPLWLCPSTRTTTSLTFIDGYDLISCLETGHSSWGRMIRTHNFGLVGLGEGQFVRHGTPVEGHLHGALMVSDVFLYTSFCAVCILCRIWFLSRSRYLLPRHQLQTSAAVGPRAALPSSTRMHRHCIPSTQRAHSCLDCVYLDCGHAPAVYAELVLIADFLSCR